MNPAKCLACLLVVVLGFGYASNLMAQGTDLGTIRGNVADPTGAMIANAKVIVLDLSTNTSRETSTNSRGEFPKDCPEHIRAGLVVTRAESKAYFLRDQSVHWTEAFREFREQRFGGRVSFRSRTQTLSGGLGLLDLDLHCPAFLCERPRGLSVPNVGRLPLRGPVSRRRRSRPSRRRSPSLSPW